MRKNITKSLLSWVLVFSLVLPLLSSVIYTQAAEGDVKDYDAMSMEEILASDESLTWVITGDSITHNGGWTAGLNSYGEWMEQYLYDSGREDDSVVLTGWGGAATDDFQTYENTPSGNGTKQDKGMGIENFITKYNPDVITIKLGMNDRYITKAQFTKQYKQILDSLYEICETQYKKIPKVIVLSPTPIASENFIDDSVLGEVKDGVYESTTRQRNALEQIVKDYNAAGKHLLFCDLRTAFLKEAEALGEDYVSTFFQDPSDGAIHPNGAGQYCIFKNLAKTLGVYDETKPIFQIKYEDLVNHALYVDSTDGLTYKANYGNASMVDDSAEMDKTMPALAGATPIASVEFNSANGALDMKDKEGFSLTTEAEGVNTLTKDEAASIGTDFSVVFRARLGAAYNNNQPVLFISSNGTANWKNALVLGVPGKQQQLYYKFMSESQDKANGSGVIGINGSTIANDGAWHTVAVIQDSGTIQYYVDGTLVDSKTGRGLVSGVESFGSMFANSTNFAAQIGRYGTIADGTSYILNGKFDYWQFYSQALTAAQVTELSPEAESGTAKVASWSDTVVENYTWAIAGGAQMASYDGVVVNRSLLRYLENAIRGGSWTYRDLHVYNLASPEYDVATLVEKFDALKDERAYDVFLLLPEVPEVYASNYTHSVDKVAAYKNNVKTLISKNSNKTVVLWTPFASNDATINGYIDDYANAVREIAGSNKQVLFFDANLFMNDNMEAKPSLLNNWFEEGQYVSPLCNVDVARAFFETMTVTMEGKGELIAHNLRYTSDEKVYKGKYVRDNIASKATVDGTTVSVDVSAIVAAYPDAQLEMVVLPYKTVENYNTSTVKLVDIAEVTISGNVYTFEAPCADLHLAIYGEQDGFIYRFKDVSLDVNTTATIPNAKADGVYLDSLEVMSAPAIKFNKDTTTYNVDLYQYQTYASVRATAQAGLTIKVNGDVVASNAISKAIKVENGSVITVEVTDGTETKTYTLNLNKASSPDIIITEVMTDGYSGYTKSGNDNYELIEIYNASGRDLNILEYSIGYKKDYTYNTVNVGNGAEFPYYFIGNNLLVSKETHAGIKELTKYSMYWKDKVDEEPEEIIFKADSTMVIWIKYSPQDTAAKREEYGAALTYETLISALAAHKGTHTLSVDIDGTETAVVPEETQIVVAEASVDMKSGSINGAAGVTAENSQKNWYLENHGVYNAGGQQTRSWLFILKDTAEVAQNYKVTEAGNDIISAAKYVRAGGTDKLSSVFSYNFERGMSIVKNEAYINDELVGKANTSDVMGYSNLTSFGAIEYWQKPADFGDVVAPTIKDNTIKELASGTEGIISLDLADNTDVRLVEVYVRQAGEENFKKVATKDFVLDAGVRNAGVSADITNTTYTCSVGEVTGTVEYYVVVTDGNGNTTSEGTQSTPSIIRLVPKVVQKYSVTDATTYVGIKAPECKQDGYLFAGWYADQTCVASPLRNLEGVEGTVYALFVVDDVLSVKAQISSNLGNDDTTDDATGSIRFVTTVDSLNYLQAGFEVSYDKDGDGIPANITKVSNKVYKKLYAVNATSGTTLEYEPTEFSSASAYFKACTVTDIPASHYAMDFTVTPFWVTPDEIEISGVTAVKSINDGIFRDYEAEIDGSFYEELEEAIAVANSNADVTTITVLNDAEVESKLDITTDIIIQNPERENITIYRGSGLAASDMFAVATGATLTIQGVDNKGTLVLDGRTKAEAVAEKGRDDVAGSSGSLISNFGNLNIDNVTVQYVRRTSGNGGVISNNGDNTTNANAMVTITDSVFDNNYAKGYASVLYTRAKATVTDSTFTNNMSPTNGGVICNHGASLFEVNGSHFANNKGAQGGVIWNDKTASITNSSFDSNSVSNEQGAAIKNSGTITVTDTAFTNNTGTQGAAVANTGTINLIGTAGNYDKAVFDGNVSSWNGGGIRSWGGTVNVTNYTFTDNHATGSKGGAIYVDSTCTINITDCKFVGNTSFANAGAVAVAGNSKGIITGTSDMAVFESNSANNTTANDDTGGALYFGSGTLQVTGYTFKNNTAGYTGGAIQIQAAATISDCTFDSNSAAIQGGAIFNQAGLTVTNCTFNKNSAASAGASTGGAIFAKSATTTVKNSTFTSNSTDYRGGAVYIESTMNMNDCTFTSNKAAKEGGAFVAYGNLTATDCKFVKNSSTGHRGGAIYIGGGKTFTLTGTNAAKALFQENTAKQGGAICVGSGTLKVTGYTFDNNSTTEYDGGGAIKLNDAAITTELTECIFTRNKGQKAGVINASGTNAAHTVTIKDCSFGGATSELGNVSTGIDSYANHGGSVIWASSNVTLKLIGTNSAKAFISNNTSNSSAGAISVNGTKVEINGYTFTGNTNLGDAHDIYNNGATITGDGNYIVYLVPSAEES